MNELSDKELDRLLKGAYAPVEVSSDFTLRLWRRLIQRPPSELWKAAVPALVVAALFGIGLGLRAQAPAGAPALREPIRWDLYGNAPQDTLAGTTLRIAREVYR